MPGRTRRRPARRSDAAWRAPYRPVPGRSKAKKSALVQRMIRPLEHAQDREAVFFVEVVEDVVVVDRQVVAASDALQDRRAGRMRIVGEADDRLADRTQWGLGDELELTIGAVCDVQLGRHF